MIIRYMVFVTCLWFFAFSVSAQMYQYKDENGNLCFTDDLTRVPSATHKTLKEMPSVKNPTQMNISSESELLLPEQAIDKDNANNILGKNAQELNHLKDELDNTYRLLQEKRASIQAENPSETSSPEEFNAFRNKVLEFNAEIASYQKRQEEFEKQVKEFNNRVKQIPVNTEK